MQIFLLQKNSAFSPKNKSRKSSIVNKIKEKYFKDKMIRRKEVDRL